MESSAAHVYVEGLSPRRRAASGWPARRCARPRPPAARVSSGGSGPAEAWHTAKRRRRVAARSMASRAATRVVKAYVRAQRLGGQEMFVPLQRSAGGDRRGRTEGTSRRPPALWFPAEVDARRAQRRVRRSAAPQSIYDNTTLAARMGTARSGRLASSSGTTVRRSLQRATQRRGRRPSTPAATCAGRRGPSWDVVAPASASTMTSRASGYGTPRHRSGTRATGRCSRTKPRPFHDASRCRWCSYRRKVLRADRLRVEGGGRESLRRTGRDRRLSGSIARHRRSPAARWSSSRDTGPCWSARRRRSTTGGARRGHVGTGTEFLTAAAPLSHGCARVRAGLRLSKLDDVAAVHGIDAGQAWVSRSNPGAPPRSRRQYPHPRTPGASAKAWHSCGPRNRPSAPISATGLDVIFNSGCARSSGRAACVVATSARHLVVSIGSTLRGTHAWPCWRCRT